MEPFLVTSPPGLAEVPHRFVLTGRIEFHQDGARHVLRAGDSIYFDNELPHGGRAPATVLVVTHEACAMDRVVGTEDPRFGAYTRAIHERFPARGVLRDPEPVP
jgi:hypothetical protein